MTIRWTVHDTPLGALLLTDHGAGLSGLYYPDHRRGRRPAPGGPGWQRDDAGFAEVTSELDRYLAGTTERVSLRTDPRGTPFQREVWAALTAIGRGVTWTYGELAAHLGRPTGTRAVAAAVGANPLSIVVPCHRVVGADGRLTGYAGGLERKRWLLELDGVGDPSR